MENLYTEKNGEYLMKNPSWHVEDSPWKASQILKMLGRNKLNPETVVEVGCGAGEILNQLYSQMPNNVRFTGYDISPDAIELAKRREKDRLKFKYEDFSKNQSESDLLLMIDVFEHIDDYLSFLKLCKGKAKNTIFHIPLDISISSLLRNKMMDARKSVGHIHYFTKETALASLIDTGYEIEDFLYTAVSLDQPRKLFRTKIAYWPRKILFSLNKDFAVKMLGGFSLLVLAK